MRTVAAFAVRYLITGTPLWGAGDNASFLHDATVDYRARPYTKLGRARWRRVARRWAGAGLPTVLWLTLGQAVALVYLGTLAAGLAGLGAYRLTRWWPGRRARRDFVHPTWSVVAKLVGDKPARRVAARNVILPPGFGSETAEDVELAPVRILLPAVPLEDKLRERIVKAAGERLGLPDAVGEWSVLGGRAYVDITARTHPPKALTYAAVRKFVDEASPVRPFAGVGAKGVPVYADLDNDGPHIGVSGGTGTGKSTLLRLLLAQRIRGGASVVCCDYKVNSHPFLRKMSLSHPGRVRYAVDEAEISSEILRVYAEFERRRGMLKRFEPLDDVQDIDLVVEELNSLAARLRTWWGHERRRVLAEAKAMDEPTPYVPVVPPAVDAMAALVQMGRELRVRVHFAAQRLDASILSPRDGGAIRESITNRFLAKYTRQTWKMLCDGVPYFTFPGGPRGIWVAVVGGEVTPFRVPQLSHDEAYALASEGLGVPAASNRRALTLSEAVALLPGPPTLEGLRKAVQRASLEPAGKDGKAFTYYLYELEELYALS